MSDFTTRDSFFSAVNGLDLPRSIRECTRSPQRSWEKLRDWLNARWQLRGCTSCGRWTRASGRIHIRNQGTIVLGDRVRIESLYIPSVFVTLDGGRLNVGDGTYINYGADIAATELVRIGSDCLIGTHCIILDNDFHDLIDRCQRPQARPVVIGDRVWIGNRVTILPGTTIGDGAVIGAGSVVRGEIPSSVVAAGNPARVIRAL